MTAEQATAHVVAVSDDVIAVESSGDTPLVKNEVIYVCPKSADGKEKLMAEVRRVRGRRADAQVYEDTVGVAVGDPVEQTGDMQKGGFPRAGRADQRHGFPRCNCHRCAAQHVQIVPIGRIRQFFRLGV